MSLLERIQSLLEGYSEVIFNDKKQGVTRTNFNKGKSIKLFAEELGGSDFVSLNYYMTSTNEILKPCEMPEQNVIHFLNNYQILKQ